MEHHPFARRVIGNHRAGLQRMMIDTVVSVGCCDQDRGGRAQVQVSMLVERRSYAMPMGMGMDRVIRQRAG
jgi:hypothetical protein